MKTLKILTLLIFISFSLISAQTKWSVDKAHTQIGFSVTHLVIAEVDGRFDNYEINVVTQGDEFEGAKINFSAEIESINTENKKRDNHLKSNDFFNAKEFPKMTFAGKSLTKVSDKNYKLVGDLTIRDVTKEVSLDVVYNGTIKDPWGNTKAGFKATTTINRFDYGLQWNAAIESGGFVVSEDVEININVELAKQK